MSGGKALRGRMEAAALRPPGKDPGRLKVLERIRELEREGRFDVDAEEDPPTLPLEPDRIDYLRKKPGSRLKVRLSYALATRFVDGLLRDGKLVIREIRGLEHLEKLDCGAILTCNHFHPFDCFTVEHLFRISGQREKRQLFKVIREGNYTNFPGFYGFLFRNCNTLPLSQNKKTMYLFLQAVDEILQRGDFILIYPEQSLWWNYRKPKPLKNGAYKFAVKNDAPVLPIFITMEDGGAIGPDGFPVQEYTIFIGKAIYPKAGLPERLRAAAMREENYAVWKEAYESFYGIPLEYGEER
ncbi:MAG: 1-acyl-sn-glycerol-3-phosphate acyltransferase [Roseburia sp.]|nr:1-acyl-sn-glycerol-3-phosphate acyltransferase [Roseburia sp.]MCM1098433.1 1-acyl-sn-glycerol-3-phosphate acyltransferase [Ruminococcus flavefaciens]